MQLYNTNSSYLALSSYTIVINSGLPKNFPILTYTRVVIADCFALNFTNLIVKIGHADGTTELVSPTRYLQRTNQFWFPAKFVSNFTIYPV
jgi:hypothetical protein